MQELDWLPKMENSSLGAGRRHVSSAIPARNRNFLITGVAANRQYTGRWRTRITLTTTALRRRSGRRA